MRRFGGKEVLLGLWIGASLCSVATADELNIDAGSGIAWIVDQQHYLATGRVRIIRGALTTWSDRARAYYADDPETITRIELEGNVRILQGNLEIEGDFANVLPESEDVVVTGDALRLQNNDIVITAKESLRYQGATRRVYAFGNVLFVQKTNKIAAENMEGILELNAEDGDLTLREAYFTENVRGDDGNSDPAQRLYIEGDRGLYQAVEQWVRVCGESRILRGDDVMLGECAHYDLTSKNFQFLRGATLASALPIVPELREESSMQSGAQPSLQTTQKRTRLLLRTKK